MKNAYLPFDRLTALSEVEGAAFPSFLPVSSTEQARCGVKIKARCKAHGAWRLLGLYFP